MQLFILLIFIKKLHILLLLPLQAVNFYVACYHMLYYFILVMNIIYHHTKSCKLRYPAAKAIDQKYPYRFYRFYWYRKAIIYTTVPICLHVQRCIGWFRSSKRKIVVVRDWILLGSMPYFCPEENCYWLYTSSPFALANL